MNETFTNTESHDGSQGNTPVDPVPTVDMIPECEAPIASVLGMDTIETYYQAPVVSAPVEETAAEEKSDDPTVPGIGHLPPSETTVQDAEVFFPLAGEWDPSGTFLVGQVDTQERSSHAVARLPNTSPLQTERGREWVEFMRESMATALEKDQWRAAVDRPGSEWRQGVKSERGNISMGALSFKNVSGEMLTGEKAVLQVRAPVGLGSTIQVPLWHSGFHITVRPRRRSLSSN
ncbi:hypothetical protein AWB67_05935 [Caballeronia terrestris]|uniref:Uncharacterized protein n=1 Tax=Caballeronia terrestris TaxID=1226301 RepID=A0A158KMH7_9BURK|nr:hypothetical protein [Caballeronia terrestris]SAL81770.1 hypothetical protein AWB67_05935 [Caballeronia terrestris]